MTTEPNFTSYQFIGDDESTSWKKVLAANMNDLDQKHAHFIRGWSKQKQFWRQPYKIYADNLTKERIAKAGKING